MKTNEAKVWGSRLRRARLADKRDGKGFSDNELAAQADALTAARASFIDSSGVEILYVFRDGSALIDSACYKQKILTGRIQRDAAARRGELSRYWSRRRKWTGRGVRRVPQGRNPYGEMALGNGGDSRGRRVANSKAERGESEDA